MDYSAGRNRYIGYLISLSTHSYKGVKVGLDCANGSTWMIAKSVFDALGADTYVIGNRPDGLEHQRGLRLHAHGRPAEAACVITDSTWASPSTATPTAAWPWTRTARSSPATRSCTSARKHMQPSAAGSDNDTLVTTVMSNFGLYKALDEAGIKYEKTAVGDKYVWENMRANGHLIGGEQSGHIIFSANTPPLVTDL